MKIPTLIEFQAVLYEISQEVAVEVTRVYNEDKKKDNFFGTGKVIVSSSVGSTVMYLDKRKPLFKFLNSIEYDPLSFYFVFIYDSKVSITLRNINTGQYYTLNKLAYDMVVEKLKDRFGWEIYNDVRID